MSQPIVSSSMDRLLQRAAITSTRPSSRLAFKAFRNGSLLGQHELTFTYRDGRLNVKFAAEFAAKLGPVTVFRYTLRGHEIWSDGRLAEAQMRSNNNGLRETMSAKLDANGLLVQGTRCRPTHFAQTIALATHWNMAQNSGPMIHPQNGALLHYNVQMHEGDVVAIAGVRCLARRYSLRGHGRVPIDLWYNEAEHWVCLKAQAVDGSLISYSLVAGLAA